MCSSTTGIVLETYVIFQSPEDNADVESEGVARSPGKVQEINERIL